MNSNSFSLRLESLPKHVAIIMDGNGRWAKKRSWNRVRGHREGTESVRDIVRMSRELGIEVLTLFAFSTENWKRPAKEVEALMKILKGFLKSELSEMMDNGIRLNAIGEIDRFPDDVLQVIRETMQKTGDNQGMLLNLALSYGARHEIVKAARDLATQVRDGRLQPEDITEEIFSGCLYTRGMPETDLLIRTSGEMRISNFLLWQIAYAEIFVTQTLWPEFRREEFVRILHDYQKRERRFGLTGDQVKKGVPSS